MDIFKVLPYTLSDKLAWNAFNLKAKNGSFLFDRDFMEYHSDRFEDASVLVFKNENVIAIFPANKVQNEIHSHQGLTYGGLVVQNDLYGSDFFSCFKAVLQYFEKLEITEVVIKAMPTIFTSQAAEELQYLAFICEAKLTRCDLHACINFNQPYRVSKSVIRDCNQTLKKLQLQVKKSDDLELFWNTLLIPNLHEAHQAKPVHNLDEILMLKTKFPENISFFGCYQQNDLIGGVVIFETPTVAHCQYISGTKQLNKLLGLSVLMQSVISYYSDKKMYFNFGTSNENQGKNINSGLLTWKEKFGARNVSQPFYSFKTTSYFKIDSILI